MVPDASDPRWRRVLTSESDLAAASLATRILVTRLRRDVKASPATLNDQIAELRSFVAKNAFAVADAARF